MIFSVYAIRDVKTGFLTPTFEVNDQVAVRNFSHAVMSGNTILDTFSKDYALYRIGRYDADRGLLLPEELPRLLLEASDV